MIQKLKKRLTIVFTVFTTSVLLVVLVVSLLYALYQQKTESNYRLASNASMASGMAPYYKDANQLEYLRQMEAKEKIIVVMLQEDEPVYITSSWQPKTTAQELLHQVKEKIETEELPMQTVVMMDIQGANMGMTENEIDYSNSIAVATTFVAGEEGNWSQIEEITLNGASGGRYNLQYYQVVVLEPSSIQLFNEETIGIVNEAGYVHVDEEIEKKAKAIYEVYILQDLSVDSQQISKIVFGYILLFIVGAMLLLISNYFLVKMAVKPTEKGLQAQAEFVAAASHELRSPLAVIRSSIAASAVSENEEQAQKYIDVVDDETVRMGRLVDDLLLLAGGDAGKWKVQQQLVDMDTLLIETTEQVTPIAKKKDVNLLLKLPEQALGQISGDKHRLRQILGVLLDNAIQYAPKESSVVLTAEKEKTTMKIYVVDHGEGVRDEDKQRVFERFYRVDNSRTAKEHFGLGLSVAKELAELHDGILKVEDTPGGGATFVLELPLRNEKEGKKSN